LHHARRARTQTRVHDVVKCQCDHVACAHRATLGRMRLPPCTSRKRAEVRGGWASVTVRIACTTAWIRCMRRLKRSLPARGTIPALWLAHASGTHVARGPRTALEKRMQIELYHCIRTCTRRRRTRASPGRCCSRRKPPGIPCPGRRVVSQRGMRTLHARAADTEPLYSPPHAHRARCGYLARMAGVRGFKGCANWAGAHQQRHGCVHDAPGWIARSAQKLLQMNGLPSQVALTIESGVWRAPKGLCSEAMARRAHRVSSHFSNVVNPGEGS
jgi:hypothetical protein